MRVAADRHGGVGHDVNDGGAHVVVAVMPAIAMLVLFERKLAFMRLARLHQANPGDEGVRFRNLVAGFQVHSAIHERASIDVATQLLLPSGRVVSMLSSAAPGNAPAAVLTRKRGGTLSSNTSMSSVRRPSAIWRISSS